VSALPDAVLGALFAVAAATSLASSWLLVSRLERIGARLGLSEGLLGMVAALAADAPEITAAVSALIGGSAQIGAGVVIGSNVFNLAALLGLSALLARRVALHRRVVALEGAVAAWIAAVCVGAVTGELAAAVALALVLAALVPYLVALGLPPAGLSRLGLPRAWIRWLREAIAEEEQELQVAIHPRPGGATDVALAGSAIAVVVAASVVMERSAATFGARHAVSQVVVGGLVVAVVTSLPNAVSAIYLARRGRGAATLSTAMNSNALNVAFGLLAPGAIVGLGAPSTTATFIAVWYFLLTVLALARAGAGAGLTRADGSLIVLAYLAFVALVLAGVASSASGALLGTLAAFAPAAVVALALGAGTGRRARGRG